MADAAGGTFTASSSMCFSSCFVETTRDIRRRSAPCRKAYCFGLPAGYDEMIVIR
jgi:hypothetical protein